MSRLTQDQSSACWHWLCWLSKHMITLVADQIKHFSHALGFTWKKALLITIGGVALGVFFALAVPLRVS